MEKIHIDPNMENDNTEHIRGKRLSSILKAPRNPLDDLGSGNELTQDLHLEKRRKNSRRVSFANTIDCRVYQRDLKNSTAENPEDVADTESNVLVHQHEEPDAVPCKITGMNTLLHAPIQAAVQQTEEDDVEDNIQATSRHNTTLIFTEENEMDMTSSHTAVITRDLKSHAEGDTGKIDITSFLAGLNSSSARAEGSREFTFFPNPANGPCPSLEQEGDVTAVKKINFNEFLKSLKSTEKAPNPAEGPDKENVFCDPSQASGDVAGPLEFVHPRKPPDTCIVTRVFRGQGEAMDVTRCQDEGMEMTRCQDEGMEMTRCQAPAIPAAFSAGCAAAPQPSPPGDVTQAFADDGMDMTTSHTAKVSFPFSSVGNQSVNCKKDFPSTGVDNSVLKTGSNQHLLVQHEPRLGADRRTVPAEDRQDPAVLRAVKQEARTMAAIPGSISSETVFRGDRSVLSSRCDDMEMTGNYTDVIYTTSTREVSSSPRKAFEKPVGTDASLLAEDRDPALADRGVPRSLVSLGDRAPVSHRPGALGLSSGSGEPVEQVTRAHGSASGAAGFDSCTSWVSAGASESKLQHRPGHPQPLPLPTEKTVIFSGEDMDLTKTCLTRGVGRNDDNEIPAGVFTSVTCKPQFLSGRSSSSNLNEQEEMEITKCHAVVIDDQSSATAAEAKQIHCKIISRNKQNNPVSRDANYPDMDKENLEVISTDGNTKRSQAMGRNSKDLGVIMVDKKPGKTNFEASGPSSYAKNICSLQEQRREDPEHSVTSTCPFVSLRSQKAVQSKPLEKSLLKASVPCSTDKTGLLPGEQNMDRARTPPAAFAAAPAAAVQEYEPSCSQSNALSKQQQNQTLQQPGSSGLGLSGQVAATEHGDLKMNPNKQTITPVAPSGSCISSKEPPPSAGKGNTQPGAVSGINAGGQDLDRQEKPHTLKAGHKALPSQASSEGELSAGRRGEDFEHPCSVGGLHSRGAEEPPLANPSEPRKGISQLPLFSDKSVVFPAGESMDWTGNSMVLAPEYNCSAAKAVPGCLVQEENKGISLKKGSLMSLTSQELPACEGYSLVCGRKASATRGLTHFPFAGEKTTIFSEDADMDITRSHTVSAEKMILQSKNPPHDVSSIPGEKTCLFTNNNDMEMSRVDTVVIDKPVGKAAAQGMFNTDGRKSLRGTAGEKTVLFLLDDENNDMEITQSHTAAIGQETVGLLPSVSSAPGKTTLLPGSQAGMDSSQACSADKTSVRAARDDHLSSGEVVGQPGEATVCAEHDMEITKSHNVPVEENSLRDQQPGPSAPFSSTILFSSGQADMEMTHVGENTTRVFPEDGSNLVKQSGWEAVPGNRTILFPSAEDMELTRMDTAMPGDELGVHNRGAIPDSPADKTTVFTHDQDDMEITASHTTAVNNNIHGLGNPCPLKVSPESTQQAALHTALSSGRDEVDSSPVADLNGECPTDSKDKTNNPSSAPSAPAFPGEDRATKAPCGTTADSIYPASLPEGTVAVQTPQDLPPLKGVSVPVSREQDLLPPENLKAKSVSSKLLSGGPLGGREDSSDLVSPVPLQQPDSSRGSPDTGSAQRSQGLEEVSSQREDPAAASGLAGGSLGPVSNRESKEKEELSAEGEAAPEGLQINSEQTKQLLASENPREQTDPSPAPELSGILNVCSKLKNIRRKSAIFPVSETACSEQLPRSSAQPEDALRVGKTTGNEHFFHSKEQENTSLESGAAPVDANVAMALQDKYQGIKVPLGIFQPKLPNRRKPSVSSVQDLNAKSSGKGGAPPSEGGVNAGDAPGTSQAGRQNFSPSQFIAEEFLPVCLEEMDSIESVSSELVESSCREISKHHISHHEKNQLEETKTFNTKRALEQDEEDLQSLKKVKRGENLDGGDSQDLQVTFGAVSQSQTEAHEGEDPPNQSAKSSDGTHASTSSLDSAKADTELTIQPSSQMESQLLTDSICEDTLREKFQSGLITVGEFLTLLQVHVPIQKPRHSHIPVSCAVSATPTPEDLLYSQFVYGPRVRVYEEDCQALSQKIEELKLYVNVQDKLLVDVNRNLWEVMRSCSDEELRTFGEELNKMKSYFTKESKVLAHNEKEALYSKLMQSAQEQQEKLQSRMEQVDELLKEAESCLLALEPDPNWKEQAADCRDEVAQEKQLEEELENIKAQEEELKRELSDLEVENQQILAQINQRKEEEESCQDLLETCDFTEWELTEWSEQQAVFSFLYDSLELTVVFGPPIEGDEFGEDPSRQIVSLSFESLLDEEKAPPSSCLVQRLIFQFIESQGCWQEKCPTLCYLSQVLQDISLVVSHCKALGEEIEFLERWGGKFHLLKTDISDTKVKLLFSAAAAFAKFELTLCLSATYPTAPLSFTVQKQIGNIGEEEIAAVLSAVPTGWHYLQRIVSSIAHSLLQGPR